MVMVRASLRRFVGSWGSLAHRGLAEGPGLAASAAPTRALGPPGDAGTLTTLETQWVDAERSYGVELEVIP